MVNYAASCFSIVSICYAFRFGNSRGQYFLKKEHKNGTYNRPVIMSRRGGVTSGHYPAMAADLFIFPAFVVMLKALGW